MSKRILVTGGAGYIGTVLVEKLLERKYEVVVLDNLLFGDEGIKHLYGNPSFILIKGDVRHIEDVTKALSGGVLAVIDLAAFVGDAMCDLNEAETITVNVEATKVLVELSTRYNIERFIFASTCSVYGFNEFNCSEETPPNPLTLYSRSKLDSERIILSAGQLVPSILRLATVYGPSKRMRFDLVLNILSAKAMKDGRITIYGGDQFRPLVHVEDVADAFIQCLEAKRKVVDHQIFNIGSNEQNYSMRQLAGLFQEFFPEIDVVYREEEKDQRSYGVNFTKIQCALNFFPRKTVKEGIAGVKELFDKGLIVDYSNRKHYNVNYRYV